MKVRKKPLPQPIRADSLAQQTCSILKEAIFAGKFQPGEALRELPIARMLSVSQATVREALNLLEQAGLVVRGNSRRTTVTSFTKEEVRDRLAMRVALEELAFVKAGERMDEDGVAELDKLCARIADAIQKDDCLKLTVADMHFHQAVWDLAESPVMVKTLVQLTTPLFAFMSVLHATGLHDLGKGKPHEALVEALRSRRPAAIRAAIRHHIEGSYQAFLDSSTPSLDALVKSEELVLVPPQR
ncbi:MAG: GntR family transcriptional regulator [Bryobacterales bacterium]|nr:GntR family transcriptional regulator [Bryobacterales bacterium]